MSLTTFHGYDVQLQGPHFDTIEQLTGNKVKSVELASVNNTQTKSGIHVSDILQACTAEKSGTRIYYDVTVHGFIQRNKLDENSIHQLAFTHEGAVFTYTALESSEEIPLPKTMSPNDRPTAYLDLLSKTLEYNKNNHQRGKKCEDIVCVTLNSNDYDALVKSDFGDHGWKVQTFGFINGNKDLRNVFLVKTNADTFFKQVKWKEIYNEDGKLCMRREMAWRKGRIGVIGLLALAILIAGIMTNGFRPSSN